MREVEFEPRNFRTKHQRSTSTLVVQDTTCQAIVRLCDIHRDLVVSSPSSFHPFLREGEPYCVPDSSGVANAHLGY